MSPSDEATSLSAPVIARLEWLRYCFERRRMQRAYTFLDEAVEEESVSMPDEEDEAEEDEAVVVVSDEEDEAEEEEADVDTVLGEEEEEDVVVGEDEVDEVDEAEAEEAEAEEVQPSGAQILLDECERVAVRDDQTGDARESA